MDAPVKGFLGAGNLRWFKLPETHNPMSLFHWASEDECIYWFWDDDSADVGHTGQRNDNVT